MAEERSCASCGGSLRRKFPFVRDAQADDTYAVLVCADCGLGHTDPIPEDIPAAYGGVYYSEQRHGITGRIRAWLRARWVERHAGESAGQNARSIVDAGCGTGEFLREMEGRGWTVGGTELEHRARQLLGTTLDVRADLEHFAERAPIGVVSMWHSLEHTTDPKAQVEAAFRLLRPGGRLVVAVPNHGGWEVKLFGRHAFQLDVPRHLYHFDLGSLERLLSDAGFTLEVVGHQELEYDVMCWLQSALNASVSPPNALFNWIIGRPLHGTRGQLAASLVLGGVLLLPALVAALVSVLVHRGSVLKVVARKSAAVREAASGASTGGGPSPRAPGPS